MAHRSDEERRFRQADAHAAKLTRTFYTSARTLSPVRFAKLFLISLAGYTKGRKNLALKRQKTALFIGSGGKELAYSRFEEPEIRNVVQNGNCYARAVALIDSKYVSWLES